MDENELKLISENEDKELELLRLKDYLNRTDHKVYKFIEGEISNEEFEPIKQKRHEARERIRELEGKK